MKNVFMILIFLSGFSMSETNAQANCNPSACKPCPPGCCIINCCLDKNAASATEGQTADMVYISSFADGFRTNSKKSSRQMKSCQVACQAASDKSASVVVSSAPSCQVIPGCAVSSYSIAVVESPPNK